jgi:hypothetical protein
MPARATLFVLKDQADNRSTPFFLQKHASKKHAVE